MTLVNFSQVLKNRDGSVMKDNDKDFTLRDIVVNSLFSEPLPRANGQSTILSTEDKVKRMRLAIKIDCSLDAIELDSKDIVFIQKALNVYPTISCAQASLMLDGETIEDLKDEFQSKSKSE